MEFGATPTNLLESDFQLRLDPLEKTASSRWLLLYYAQTLITIYVRRSKSKSWDWDSHCSVEESNHSSYFFSILSFKNASLPAKIRILHIARVVGGSTLEIESQSFRVRNLKVLHSYLLTARKHRGFKSCAGGSCSKVFSTDCHFQSLGLKIYEKGGLVKVFQLTPQPP